MTRPDRVRRRAIRGVVVTLGLLAAFAAAAFTQLPALGAGGLLHPARRALTVPAPEGCVDERMAGDGVELAGWRCTAVDTRRGTLVYLHGIADNRGGAAGAIQRFRRQGWDVIAFDSRAHGQSGGEMCTYGFHEKRDLGRVLETVSPGPIVLLGTSLGAAVALQHAADNPQVNAVISAEAFSDLATVARERAPFFFTDGVIAKAFVLAEERAHFDVDDTSPQEAASKLTIPVLLIHGESDQETSPDHSRRIFAALQGPKTLLVVPGMGHNQSLTAEVWRRIEEWIDLQVPR